MTETWPAKTSFSPEASWVARLVLRQATSTVLEPTGRRNRQTHQNGYLQRLLTLHHTSVLPGRDWSMLWLARFGVTAGCMSRRREVQ